MVTNYATENGFTAINVVRAIVLYTFFFPSNLSVNVQQTIDILNESFVCSNK